MASQTLVSAHRLFLSLGLSLGLTSALHAQRTTEESFIPKYSIGGTYFTWNSEVDFSDEAGSLQQAEAGIVANFPLYQTEGFRLTGGVSYRWNQLDFSGAPGALGSQTFDLHRLDVPFNAWADLNDRWRLWIRAQPGIYSDFDDISSDDFILTSLALLSYQWSDATRIAFGGFYSKDLGEEKLLPAVGVIIEPNAYWYLAVTFPRLEVAYAPTEDWLFAGRALLSGAGWNISNPTGSGEDVDLNYKRLRAGLGVDHRLSGPWWAYIDAGVQFGQEIEIDGVGFEDEDKYDLDTGAYITAGVRLRF